MEAVNVSPRPRRFRNVYEKDPRGPKNLCSLVWKLLPTGIGAKPGNHDCSAGRSTAAADDLESAAILNRVSLGFVNFDEDFFGLILHRIWGVVRRRRISGFRWVPVK